MQPKTKGGLGIRTARNSNTSLLGKHIWDLLHNSEKLWVQLLASKYLKGSNILDVVIPVGSSYGWRSICKALNSLKNGFQFRVGAGTLSIWYDKWGDNDPLCRLVLFVDIQDINLQLKDIFRD